MVFRKIAGCILTAAAVMCALTAVNASDATMVKYVPTPSTSGKNSFYQGNRAPMVASPLIKLPVGSVKPQGWLKHQLELEAEGFSGRLTEISPWCKFEGSAWVSPNGVGANGWEELPYWLKGYVDLGYVLGDQRIIDEAKKWVEGIMSTQRPDGYFGPESNLEAMDLWPNMVALYAVRSYYDATGDKRVITFMTNYCKWLNTLTFDQFLPGSWQKVRGGDNLDNIHWLYNQTGEKWLLDLARINHERTADWTGGVMSWHGVNFAQCFREPAQFYQQTNDIRYFKAAERNYDAAINAYGQVPGGGIGADENCRPGYNGPRQGTETCTWVEFMYSHEMLTGITGDPKWADRCEEIAFNSLPASMTPDMKALHYLTAPNQIQLDRQNKAPMIQNGGDMFSYDPRSYRCCQHNVAFGWPYYSEYLWMATPGNGLAAVMYTASEVSAKVGNGVPVKITETTNYPFDEIVAFKVSAPKSVRFPLYLRIPGWCENPQFKVNGTEVKVNAPAKGWVMIDRTWKDGDDVKLQLPMDVKIKTWESNRNAVSVYRGPLAYSVKIGENWKSYRADDKWAPYEVFPTTEWNYGLVLDQQSFESVKLKRTVPDQPFTPDNAPIGIKVKAKKIPQWKQEQNGMIGEIQKSPIKSSEPVEEITLIPMGCTRLRVSSFPVVSDGPDAKEWDDTSITTDVSFSNPGDTISALTDNLIPVNSADTSVPRFTWWDHRGSWEWISYTFNKSKKFGWVEVYWYDDTPTGGGCAIPESWKALYWDGNQWQPIANPSGFGIERNKFNRVTFTPVETSQIKLEVKLRPNLSGGVLECRMGE